MRSSLSARRITVATIVLATAAALGAQNSAKPAILILTTGGTIASRAGVPMEGSSLIGAVPQLDEHALVRVEEVTRVGTY